MRPYLRQQPERRGHEPTAAINTAKNLSHHELPEARVHDTLPCSSTRSKTVYATCIHEKALLHICFSFSCCFFSTTSTFCWQDSPEREAWGMSLGTAFAEYCSVCDLAGTQLTARRPSHSAQPFHTSKDSKIAKYALKVGRGQASTTERTYHNISCT